MIQRRLLRSIALYKEVISKDAITYDGAGDAERCGTITGSMRRKDDAPAGIVPNEFSLFGTKIVPNKLNSLGTIFGPYVRRGVLTGGVSFGKIGSVETLA